MMDPQSISPAMVKEAFNHVSHSHPTTGSDKEDIIKLKWLFMACAREVCPTFRITAEQRQLISVIFDWCIRRHGKLDPDKGLWLYGDIGSGKTTMLKIIRLFCSHVRPGIIPGYRYSFRISNVSQVCGEFSKYGYEGIETFINSPCQAFDEVGSESRAIGHFGTVENVMQYIFQRRYDNRYSSFTHVTTNFSPEGIIRLYGPRIFDRCREMFNFVEYRGESFRKELEHSYRKD